jgi:tRNA nucleotidyltransferase (CCA-adding enzyme)
VDADTRELALLVGREWPLMHGGDRFDAPAALALLERCDAWRRPERIGLALTAFESLAGMLAPARRTVVSQRCAQLQRALAAAQAVNTASLPPAVRAAAPDGPALGAALRQARLQAITQALARS